MKIGEVKSMLYL